MPYTSPKGKREELGEPPLDSLAYRSDWLNTERGFEGMFYKALEYTQGLEVCPVCGLSVLACGEPGTTMKPSWPQIRTVSYFDHKLGEIECVLVYCPRCTVPLARFRIWLEDPPHDPEERKLPRAGDHYNIPGRKD